MSLSPQLNNSNNTQETLPTEGYVQGGKEGSWLVTTNQGLIRANQAYSCLVQPVLGDKVLLQSVGKTTYLLAILERQQPLAMQINAKQGLTFDLGGQDCQWKNTGQWQLQAATTKVLSQHVELTTQTGKVSGKQLTQHWQQVRNLIEDFWHSGQTVWQQVRQSISRVDEVEQKDSGHHIQRVRGNMTLHSEQASITSTKDLRIDAERIHMG
ncbi:MAG: DUF3540 domain-containing protein [Pseudomonadaceae bacterium]|nr:DUF3540 domain-containing protein [Pseudomonadaceae bacterium]